MNEANCTMSNKEPAPKDASVLNEAYQNEEYEVNEAYHNEEFELNEVYHNEESEDYLQSQLDIFDSYVIEEELKSQIGHVTTVCGGSQKINRSFSNKISAPKEIDVNYSQSQSQVRAYDLYVGEEKSNSSQIGNVNMMKPKKFRYKVPIFYKLQNCNVNIHN